MNVLLVDVGGTHVKVLATGQKDHRQFESGPVMTAKEMGSGVRIGLRRRERPVMRSEADFSRLGGRADVAGPGVRVDKFALQTTHAANDIARNAATA